MPELRTLLVDDEPLARENLRWMLGDRDGCRIIGEAGSVQEAREILAREPVDLLLLDIRMPGASGLDLARELDAGRRPVVIFVTAHEEFALAAFGVGAVDYLLKPFDEQRLARALERAAERCAPDARTPQLGQLAAQLRVAPGQTPGGEVARAARVEGGDVLIPDASRVRRVALTDVVWFQSSHNYIRVHTKEWWHLIRMPLWELEQQLDPDAFVRIHRTAIINRACVRDLRIGASGDYLVRLTNGAQLAISRRRRAALAQLRAMLERPLADTSKERPRPPIAGNHGRSA